MKEIEVKAKLEDLQAIKNKLIELGCVFSEKLTQEDKIYLPESVKFTAIQKDTPVVRVRNSNGQITLTMKKRLANGLSKIEKETIVENGQQTEEIVKHMSFYEVTNVSKERIQCTYKNMELCLDEVAGLGSFIEAEVISSEDDKNDEEEIQADLWQFLKSLGVKESDRAFKGYDILLYEKKTKQSIT